MKLGKIALKIRMSNTRFESNVCGAAELDLALNNTLLQESCFVIPLAENSTENDLDAAINQEITERFGVIVAIKCDTTQKDKTGLIAHDSLYEVRNEIFKAILGWQIQESESVIMYRGGVLLGFNNAWLWYQYEFEYISRVNSVCDDLRNVQIQVTGVEEYEGGYPDPFEKIYANFILAPDERLPYTGELPLPDGYPDVFIPDIAQMVDLTHSNVEGGYNRGYASGFDFFGDKSKYRGG